MHHRLLQIDLYKNEHEKYHEKKNIQNACIHMQIHDFFFDFFKFVKFVKLQLLNASLRESKHQKIYFKFIFDF